MKKIKIGFLPLYIKLYDDCGSGAVGRPRLEPFYERLACELEARGFEVIRNCQWEGTTENGTSCADMADASGGLSGIEEHQAAQGHN